MAKVSSVRFYSDQIARLKKSKNFVDIIDCAIKRYDAGELNLVFRGENYGKAMETLSVRRKFPYSGEKLRAILDAHFNTPRERLEKDLENASKEVDALMAFYTGQKYILDSKD